MSRPSLPTRIVLRLAATSVALLALLAAGDRLVAGAVARSAAWQRGTENPRQRILWDRKDDGSRVVIVGDSVLASCYVDTPAQTLWARLQARLGAPVFPASLDGATPADLLLVARRVAARWPAGTIALVGVHPARIFVDDGPVPETSRYEAWLDDGSPFASRLGPFLADHLFLVGRYERLQEYFHGTLAPEASYYGAGVNRDRHWKDDGFARWRFDDLAGVLEAGGAHRLLTRLDWIDAMDAALRRGGLRPVFVLTPLNQAQLHEHAVGHERVLRVLAASRARLLDRLEARGHEFIDLYTALDAASFADLIHPNVRGDDRLAAALAAAVRGEQRATP